MYKAKVTVTSKGDVLLDVFTKEEAKAALLALEGKALVQFMKDANFKIKVEKLEEFEEEPKS